VVDPQVDVVQDDVVAEHLAHAGELDQRAIAASSHGR